MNRNQVRKHESGFSLVEILIAVTIVVLMGGVVAVNVFPYLFKSQRDRADIDIKQLKEAVKLFKLNEGRLPRENEWPEFLVKGSKSHPHPYVDEDVIENGEVVDPWGNPYVYRRTGRDFEIISYGEDGQQGGEAEAADISSKKSQE